MQGEHSRIRSRNDPYHGCNLITRSQTDNIQLQIMNILSAMDRILHNMNDEVIIFQRSAAEVNEALI